MVASLTLHLAIRHGLPSEQLATFSPPGAGKSPPRGLYLGPMPRLSRRSQAAARPCRRPLAPLLAVTHSLRKCSPRRSNACLIQPVGRATPDLAGHRGDED